MTAHAQSTWWACTILHTVFPKHVHWSEELTDQVISSIISKKPARYRRAISYDSKEYYMRLASGNPAVFQDAIEENTVGETTQQEPEHGEDTIARVKG